MASLVSDQLVKIALLHPLPVFYVFVVNLFDLWPVNRELKRNISGDLTPVFIHPVALFLRYVAHFRLFLFGWHVLFDALTLALLLLHENFEQLFKVKLELVSVAFFFFLELLNGDNVLAEAVLHFLCQHQFLFVEAQEDLKVHEVALVVLPLVICGVPFYVHP